jgi:hypothetical protein
MKLYADRPARLLPQLLGDVLLVVLLWTCVRAGRAVHDHVAALAGPGRDAEAAGLKFQSGMRDAAHNLTNVPFVGDSVAKPFRTAAGSGRDLADAAQSFQDTVAQVAVVLGLLVALVPAVLLLALWLPKRVAWIVEASAANRLSREGPRSADLLALRALTRQSLPVLARLSPDVAAGWRAGDPATIQELASLELQELGLRGLRTAEPTRR